MQPPLIGHESEIDLLHNKNSFKSIYALHAIIGACLSNARTDAPIIATKKFTLYYFI